MREKLGLLLSHVLKYKNYIGRGRRIYTIFCKEKTMHSLSLSLMKSLFVLMRKKIIIIHYFVSLWKPSRISLLTINRKSEKNEGYLYLLSSPEI